MRDRQLHRSKTASVSVVGLLPSCIGNQTDLIKAAYYGGSQSGIAYLVGPSSLDGHSDKSSANIIIWKQNIATLSEEIAPSDEAPVIEFQHPNGMAGFEGDLNELKNMVAIAKSSSVSYASAQKRNDNVYNSFSLYWASPDGHICYWNDISESHRECDIITSLPMENDEFVTYISYNDTLNGSGSILVGTSMNRTFHVVKNTRPLELQSRLLLSDDFKYSNIDGETSSQGLLGGLYSMFTPSKPKKSLSTKSSDENLPSKSGKIVGLFQHSLSSQLFSPSKRAKHHHPHQKSQNFIYSVTDDGSIAMWGLDFNSQDGFYSGRFVDVSNISSVVRLELNGDEVLNDVSVTNVDIDSAGQSASISACVKANVSNRSGKNTSRYYIVNYDINEENGHLQYEKCTWLSRYAHEGISSRSNPIRCAGLVTAIEDIGGQWCTVVYAAFQQMHSNGPLPVTVSAVRFAAGVPTSTVDIDMNPDVIPDTVTGTLQHDRATDGRNLISSTATVSNVRAVFPSLRASIPSTSLSSNVDESVVETVASHLLSSFKSHQRSSDSYYNLPMSPNVGRATSPYSKRLDSLLPPSIAEADGLTLSRAVVLVSKQLVDEPRSALSAIETIQEKCEIHQDFLKYLFHTGVYKRILFFGRVSLRDHGEEIFAIGNLLNTWEQLVNSNNGDIVIDEALAGNFAEEIIIIGDALQNIEQTVTLLPSKFTSTFESILSDASTRGLDSTWCLLVLMKLLRDATYNSLQYREDQSEKSYDLLDSDSSASYHEQNFSPWSSDNDYLTMIESALGALYRAVSEEESSKETLSRGRQFIGEIVADLSSALLQGYKDKPTSTRDEAKYDTSKNLCYCLANAFCPVETVFKISASHHHFSGMVEICYENCRHGEFDESFNLPRLLEESCDDTTELHRAVDYETGLNFAKFTLQWYTEKSLIGTALKLGKYCESDLSEYIEQDERLSNYRWIQHSNSNQFLKASKGLMSLTSKGLNIIDNSNIQTLQSRQLVLSLAKLGAMASDGSLEKQNITMSCDENLDLCIAQETLVELSESDESMDKIMDMGSLLSLSTSLLRSCKNVEDKVRAAVAGLLVARCIENRKKSSISSIWAEVIDVEAQRWRDLVEQWHLLSDTERVQKVESTIFCRVASVYHVNPEKKGSDVASFNNVRDEVFRLLSVEDEKLAEILFTSFNFYSK